MTLVAPSRRCFLRDSAILSAGLLLPLRAFGDTHTKIQDALARSPLVYISPLKSDGNESRCHGEIWFVTEGDDVLVVTPPERWRAACVSQGLDRARIWVGDFGPWKRSKGAFRDAPSYLAKASLEADPSAHARALAAFGKKYPDGWGEWGPRFTRGLASGERVLVRYTQAS